MPASLGQFLQGRIQQDPAVAAFNDRRLFRRAERLEDFLPLLGFRVEPGEGDKVLVQKLANGIRIAAPARADDAQSEHAHLRQQLAATGERDDQLFAEAGHAIEQSPEMAARHCADASHALRHRGHNHRTTGQKVDVAGKLARIVGDDHLMPSVGLRMSIWPDSTTKIDIGLAGAKDRFAIRVVVGVASGRSTVSSASVNCGKAIFSVFATDLFLECRDSNAPRDYTTDCTPGSKERTLVMP